MTLDELNSAVATATSKPKSEASKAVAAVLHGIQGQLTVKGKVYSGVMPSFAAQLSDAEMSAVLTHIRKSWGNQAAPVGVVSSFSAPA